MLNLCVCGSYHVLAAVGTPILVDADCTSTGWQGQAQHKDKDMSCITCLCVQHLDARMSTSNTPHRSKNKHCLAQSTIGQTMQQHILYEALKKFVDIACNPIDKVLNA